MWGSLKVTKYDETNFFNRQHSTDTLEVKLVVVVVHLFGL
jgi:hypothetical protein